MNKHLKTSSNKGPVLDVSGFTLYVLLFISRVSSLSLLQDLLNFDDPLNIDAAEHHLRDKVGYIQGDSNLIFNRL